MLTVFALMLASFLTAVDVTIVDTAMPRIVGSLGGFAMLTWLVSAYMLTSTATMPVYGKLADIIGRKKTFTIGGVLDLRHRLRPLRRGAVDAGPDPLPCACRGSGPGRCSPPCRRFWGEIFSPAERAKVQGWFGGLGILCPGRAAGGRADGRFLTWRYLFYIQSAPGRPGPLHGLALFLTSGSSGARPGSTIW